MGCYFVHNISCKNVDIDMPTLLRQNNLLDKCGTGWNLAYLNLKRCSEQDYISEKLNEEQWRIALYGDKTISYMSKNDSDTPIYYISKAFPDLEFIENSHYAAICNSRRCIREWKNGKCVLKRMGEILF